MTCSCVFLWACVSVSAHGTRIPMQPKLRMQPTEDVRSDLQCGLCSLAYDQLLVPRPDRVQEAPTGPERVVRAIKAVPAWVQSGYAPRVPGPESQWQSTRGGNRLSWGGLPRPPLRLPHNSCLGPDRGGTQTPPVDRGGPHEPKGFQHPPSRMGALRTRFHAPPAPNPQLACYGCMLGGLAGTRGHA